MGEFANGVVNRVVPILLSFVVIAINIFFGLNLVQEAELSVGWIVLVGVFAPAYILFCFYLIIHMCCFMGFNRLFSHSYVKEYVLKSNFAS